MGIDHRKALDYASAGKWEEAHTLVQSYSDRISCLIHGYLHRVEGDMGNARYWYQRANEDLPGDTLEEEFARLSRLVDSISAA